MQVMLMRLMSKGEYLIVPKGTKFTGAGKLGLKGHWTSVTAIFSSSYRGFKIKPIPKISADSANAFSFYEVFCEKHHLQSAP